MKVVSSNSQLTDIQNVGGSPKPESKPEQKSSPEIKKDHQEISQTKTGSIPANKVNIASPKPRGKGIEALVGLGLPGVLTLMTASSVTGKIAGVTLANAGVLLQTHLNGEFATKAGNATLLAGGISATGAAIFTASKTGNAKLAASVGAGVGAATLATARIIDSFTDKNSNKETKIKAPLTPAALIVGGVAGSLLTKSATGKGIATAVVGAGLLEYFMRDYYADASIEKKVTTVALGIPTIGAAAVTAYLGKSSLAAAAIGGVGLMATMGAANLVDKLIK